MHEEHTYKKYKNAKNKLQMHMDEMNYDIIFQFLHPAVNENTIMKVLADPTNVIDLATSGKNLN